MKFSGIICIAGVLIFTSCKEHHSGSRNEASQIAAVENNNMSLQELIPESIKGIQLAQPELFPEKYKAPARVVAEELSKDKENPQEFFAEIEPKLQSKILLFHLWHEDAFKKENQGVNGNPGGKCRTFYYDLKQGTITKKLFWQ